MTQIRDGTGAADQAWSQTASHERTVCTGGSRPCLDASGAATANGTLLQLWTCNGSSYQKRTPD